MNRRIASGLAVLTTLAIVGCGSDRSSGDTLPPVTPTVPETTPGPDVPATTDAAPVDTVAPTPTDAAPKPDTADESAVVVDYTVLPGYVPIEVAFGTGPRVLVTADGRVFTPGLVTLRFPGPLVTPYAVQSITPAGIERLIAAADDAGLLAPVVYPQTVGIADAPTTVLTIDVDGTEYVHEVYAFGLGESASPEEQRLDDFLGSLNDLAGVVGADEVGTAELWVPDGYQFSAFPIDVATIDRGVDPTVVEWPLDIDLAAFDGPAGCVDIDRSEVGDLFDSASALTFFSQDGTDYQVLVRPRLPGTDPC